MLDKLPTLECIVALIPSYGDAGENMTLILTTEGQKLVNTHIRSVINTLARRHATDLLAVKQKATRATEQAILQPLLLAPGFILCPIKVRIPKVPGDASIGYINFHAVASTSSFQDKPYRTILKFHNGSELPVIWSLPTVKRHLQYARLIMPYTNYDDKLPPSLVQFAQKFIEGFCGMLLSKHDKE